MFVSVEYKSHNILHRFIYDLPWRCFKKHLENVFEHFKMTWRKYIWVEEETGKRLHKENTEDWRKNHINTQTQEIQNKTFSGALTRRAQHILGSQYFVFCYLLVTDKLVLHYLVANMPACRLPEKNTASALVFHYQNVFTFKTNVHFTAPVSVRLF